MPELLLLGSGAGFVEPHRQPTMLALRGSASIVLIDCGTDPTVPLRQLGVSLDTVERLIVTHSHKDHTLGFAQMVESLGRAGRRHPLPVHGPADALEKVQSVLAEAGPSAQPALFELEWHTVPLSLHAIIAHTADFDLTAAPGNHSVPVIGLRVRAVHGGGVMTYGCDGEVSAGIRALAQGTDLLVHEAKGLVEGHATALAAAELARQVRAQRLVLVHYASDRPDLRSDYQAAVAAFGGDVRLGQDGERYPF